MTGIVAIHSVLGRSATRHASQEPGRIGGSVMEPAGGMASGRQKRLGVRL